jgi:hypothetical protein
MKRLLLFALIVWLAGCATSSVQMVAPGDHLVGTRLSLAIQDNWNHFDFPLFKPPGACEVWTMEGLSIDELILYTGVKDGDALYVASERNQAKRTQFQSAMQTEDVIALFERLLTRDNSTFKLLRLEPYPFGGKKGFRFEYERIRRLDHVQQQGIGFGAIDEGELFALIYQAPRLTFFPRHRQRVEELAKSAVIRPKTP